MSFYVCYKSLLVTKIIIDSGRFLDKFSGKVAFYVTFNAAR